MAQVPAVAGAVERVRTACTQLRWHNALRKRMAECRAEATVRAARTSAALEGARYPLNYVREVIGAGREVTDDMSGVQLTAAVRVAAVADELSQTPDALRSGFMGHLARLSLAAGAGLADDDQLGRPRRAGEEPGDMGGLPAAPSPDEVQQRLADLEALLQDESLPGFVVACILHGEILAMRPFVIGNGLIARALFRIHMVSSGVDVTGVAVPEAALLSDAAGYGEAGAAYTSGRDVIGWITMNAEAVEKGVGEGVQICQSVQAGRIPRT
ncbi:Fic/DOC family protein [Brevibacterium ravenspurgense]|uniref:Fic/DOC family protein n=1 Tax=Brevibacterium ravenspurgense TaxID=479117 RepID=A0A150HB52_9MICO|nr:Fic family protein [Brevibacterium ravenspurgense]KXZ59038.1 Fic/DOC family protein [Brevibacterium ravenspurgense]